MKTIMKYGIYFAIYILLSIGAVMAVQHSWWYMIPSIVTISFGFALIEFYARNWDKFNK